MTGSGDNNHLSANVADRPGAASRGCHLVAKKEPFETRCQVPCDSLAQRVWRLSAARDAMKQLYQHLGTSR